MRAAKTIDGLFSQFTRVVIMGAGMLMVLNGRLSVGAIAAILALQGNAMYLFQNIASFRTELDNALPSIRRIEEIRQVQAEDAVQEEEEEEEKEKEKEKEEEKEKEKEKEEGEGEEHTASVKTAVSFDQVSFSFGGRKILDHVSFQIPQGSFVLFVGESGAGKSTLGKLLLRFYQEAEGSCTVLGKNSRTSRPGEIRKQIAYMDQHHKIFSMSVIDNLRMVQEEPDDEQIKRVCGLTGVDSFVKDWAEGYQYQIADDFSNLSGGQKQRLALARMLVSDRPVFLIDEGTANLDEETERMVMQSLLRLKGEKTILMITHRLALAELADRVYELREGRLRLLDASHCAGGQTGTETD